MSQLMRRDMDAQGFAVDAQTLEAVRAGQRGVAKHQMQPTSVLGDTFPNAYSYTSQYDAAGRLVKRTMGNSNNIVVQSAYEPFTQHGGRLQRLMAGVTGDPASLMDFTYAYDPVGSILNITDAKNSGQVQSFAYDALDRLTSGGTTLVGEGQFALQSYTYHPTTGSLSSKAGVTYTYGDPAHAHAVTGLSNGNTYGYDPNGNMTTRHVLESGVWHDDTLAYDGDNRLMAVTGAAQAEFGYDGDGRRIYATTSLTTTVFVGSYFEWNVALGEGVSYYYAGATRLAMRTGGQAAVFFVIDHLGSVNQLVDPYGAPLAGERQRYMPWGEKRLSTSISLTRVGYTGQYDQAEIGLMFYQARWYDAYLNRWASPDNIVPLTTQGVQALDRYAYANNNPIRFNDPSGHSLWDVIGQFSTGYVKEFTLRNVGWVSPKAQADLGVDATETTAELAGRVVADAATIILGIDNLLGGAAIASGGSVVACGVTACLGAAATATAGAAIAVVGVAQTAQGAMGLGGNLAQLTGSNGQGSADARGFWEVTEENSIRVMRHDAFGTFYRSKSDGLWWVKDNASHGGVVWKVYKQTSKGLEWIADADKYGDFIANKHKGPTGYFIPWDQLYAK